MEQIAIVKSIQNNGMAQVVVRRTTACAHDCDKCAGCEQLNTRMENTVTAFNDIHAAPGDLVRIQSENTTFFKTAAIVYILPLVLALVFYGWPPPSTWAARGCTPWPPLWASWWAFPSSWPGTGT